MHAKDVQVFGDESWMWMHIRRASEVYRQEMDGFPNDFPATKFGFQVPH